MAKTEKIKTNRKIDNGVSTPVNVLLHILFIALCFISVYPVLLVLGASFSEGNSIVEYGYHVIPKVFSLEAYMLVFAKPITVFRAYGITIFNTVVGTICSVFIVALYAYPLSRSDFKYRMVFTFFIFFTMLFNGGMVPWYMVCVAIGLRDNIWAMIIPYFFNAWNCIILRTFFQTTIPPSLIESAKIDGAGEWRVFFRIVMPLSLPGVATIALFVTLQYWNDWWLPIMLIDNSDLFNLQALLQSILKSIDALKNAAMQGSSEALASLAKVPSDTANMALCMVALGPILIVYPFFQKYFISGLTIGAVKG